MLLFQQSEATAAQRRVPLHLVDATDGITAETGEAGGQPQVSKNGAAFGNTSATLTAIGNGAYYVELIGTELDTLGFIMVRFKSAATAEAQVIGQVVPWDPYDAVRAGLTALPNAAAEAAGGLYTRGTGAGQINQPANGLIDANTLRWNGTAVATPTVAGVPEVDLTHIAGVLVSTTTAQLGANVVQVSGDATAADRLEEAATSVIVGSVDASPAPTTTAFAFTGLLGHTADATNDNYNGKIVTFLTGAMAGQSTDVTDYTGATKLLTVTALTEAPASADQFTLT